MGKPLVTSLDDCWARPEQHLRDHLLEVASASGDANGSLEKQLAFLAGLLHDAGKARPTWQDYFERSRNREPGLATIPHAYVGAALFAVYARALLNISESSLESEQIYFLLVQDLQDHHGRLRDRYTPPDPISVPWHISLQQHPPEDALLSDIDDLVHGFFPNLPLRIGTYQEFQHALSDLARTWAKQLKRHNRKLEKTTGGSSANYAVWTSRNYTGSLIAADRLSASKRQDLSQLNTEKAVEALAAFKTNLDKKYQDAVAEGYEAMAQKRRDVHEQALQNYLAKRDSTWFSLNLPVGWGKTLTSLRVALEHAAAGRAKRIVYVAPYLAILTQAAKEIREATGLEVMEHHHLALLTDATERHEPLDVLTMESWQAPVVATTFNQLFRAIFPASAQQSIRIPALKDAFIIIDEPQIINAGVYNAFLKGLEALGERMNTQTMLVTATLPPTRHGLREKPHDLTPPVESANRYTLITHAEPWTAERLVREALERIEQHKQVAIILNTIADAVNAYRLASESLGRETCLNLHGLMTPLHKAHQIAEVSRRLRNKQSVLVVSTQVLEAGVDLSFRCILRARPILSSVAQAAGRGNRHAEGDTARIEVFDFLRESRRDVRKIIYRSEQQRRVTDELLKPPGSWSEAQTAALVEQYFEKLSIVEANIAVFQRFKRAAEGEWSQLAKLTPFDTAADDDGNELRVEYNASVFTATVETPWLTDVQKWLHTFNIKTVSDVYSMYQDKRFLARLDFGDRKRFIGLVRQFVAPLRWRLVPQVCGRLDVEGVYILRALDDSTYHLDTGFGHLLSRTHYDDYERRLESRMSREYDADFL